MRAGGREMMRGKRSVDLPSRLGRVDVEVRYPPRRRLRERGTCRLYREVVGREDRRGLDDGKEGRRELKFVEVKRKVSQRATRPGAKLAQLLH